MRDEHDTERDVWAQVARWQAVAMVSIGICGVLAIIVMYQVLQGATIHYIVPAQDGMSVAGVIPDVYAEEIAARMVERRYTFTPASVKHVHRQVEALLHPALIVTFKKQTETEEDMVKKHQMSVQTSTSQAQVVQRTGTRALVVVDARRSIYIGGVEVRQEVIRAEVQVAQWSGSGRHGVLVSGLTVDQALTVGGKP